MDKILWPQMFETFPSLSHAVKDWRHWLATFGNFLQSIEQYASDRRKLHLNFIGPSVYELISDCLDYKWAISKLQQSYDKPKNKIHARYILSMHQQKPEEALDEFLLNLRRLCEDCNNKAVNAEEHRCLHEWTSVH